MMNFFLSQLRWTAKTELIMAQAGMEFMEPASVCLKMDFGSKISDKKKSAFEEVMKKEAIYHEKFYNMYWLVKGACKKQK